MLTHEHKCSINLKYCEHDNKANQIYTYINIYTYNTDTFIYIDIFVYKHTI